MSIMEDSESRRATHFRHWSLSSHVGSYRGPSPLYRQNSNMSTTSFVSEVEMAHDEVFAGPISESVPSGTTGFANRRDRTGSTASFTYYPDEESLEDPAWQEGEETEHNIRADEESLLDGLVGDIEAGLRSPARRKSSSLSRISVDDPLLARSSSKIDARIWDSDRTTQKIYIATEDLTVVLAGFKTSKLGYALYLLLCLATAGLGYLLFRWLPRWKVRLIGSSSSLRDCHWVVIEVKASEQYSMFKLRFRRTNGESSPSTLSRPGSMATQCPQSSVLRRKGSTSTLRKTKIRI